MLGLMQNQPLSISNLIEFAARHHHEARSCRAASRATSTATPTARRPHGRRRVAHALDRLDLAFSDRVATLAWNGYRHFELYFGVSGSGRVVHTLNPRLAPDQMAWIVNHAEDRVLCFDMTFLPLVKAIWRQCTTVKHWIALCDADALPATAASPACKATRPGSAARATPTTGRSSTRSSAATLCYTSGTTGNPKGALYSHRSTVLHAYGVALPDAVNLSARDCILPVVPMFHVNAWGIPYARGDDRRQAGVPGAGTGRQVGLRTDRGRARDHGRRRADGMADAAEPRASRTA